MFECDPYAFGKSAFEFPSTQILGARNYIARADRETLKSNAFYEQTATYNYGKFSCQALDPLDTFYQPAFQAIGF